MPEPSCYISPQNPKSSLLLYLTVQITTALITQKLTLGFPLKYCNLGNSST